MRTTFTQDPIDATVWTVDVRAATDSDELVLPNAPAAF